MWAYSTVTYSLLDIWIGKCCCVIKLFCELTVKEIFHRNFTRQVGEYLIYLWLLQNWWEETLQKFCSSVFNALFSINVYLEEGKILHSDCFSSLCKIKTFFFYSIVSFRSQYICFRDVNGKRGSDGFVYRWWPSSDNRLLSFRSRIECKSWHQLVFELG